VLRGAAYDVIVDIRRESPTYLRWHGVELKASEHTQVYIPAGCLHGFLALEDDTLLSYKQSATYDPATEIGVRWDDPDLAIAWPLGAAQPLLSPKDASNPTLRRLGLL
jgi:dTDP-4-dehydrorhamnose 3,5-epimerase